MVRDWVRPKKGVGRRQSSVQCSVIEGIFRSSGLLAVTCDGFVEMCLLVQNKGKYEGS